MLLPGGRRSVNLPEGILVLNLDTQNMQEMAIESAPIKGLTSQCCLCRTQRAGHRTTNWAGKWDKMGRFELLDRGVSPVRSDPYTLTYYQGSLRINVNPLPDMTAGSFLTGEKSAIASICAWNSGRQQLQNCEADLLSLIGNLYWGYLMIFGDMNQVEKKQPTNLRLHLHILHQCARISLGFPQSFVSLWCRGGRRLANRWLQRQLVGIWGFQRLDTDGLN